MRAKQSIYRRICDSADLPDEPLPNQPLVEIVGCDRLLIENHKGVARYDTECIQICVGFGRLIIHGTKLELKRMTKGQLIVSGQLQQICIERG